MLKWLVQRVPDPGGRGDAPGLQDLITDDPLAVIDLNEARESAAKGGDVGDNGTKAKKGKAILGKRNKKRRKQEIYSVNR